MARTKRKVSPFTAETAAPVVKEAKRYKTAGYARLSVEDSGKPGSETLESQKRLIMEFINNAPDMEFSSLFYDNGETGTDFRRPGFERLMDAVRKGEVNCIVVKDLSRFGRNYKETGNYLERIFPFLGVRFIAITDSFDTLTAERGANGYIVPLKNLINETYSRDISKKISSAVHTKQQRGEFIGAWAPYGYRKDPEDKHKLVPNPDTAPVVQRLFQMRLNGKFRIGCTYHPWPRISDDNFWTAQGVTKIIRDKRYTGCVIYGKRRRDIVGSTHTVKAARDKWIVAEGTHEAIISKEQFDEAQSRLREYRSHASNKAVAPLAKKVYCGCCGRAMKRSNSKNRYYTCDTPRYTDEYDCNDEHIPEADIFDAVLTTLRAYARLAVDLDQILFRQQEQARIDRKQLQRKLMVTKSKKDQTERRLQDMYEAYFEGGVGKEEYIARKHTLSGQLSQLAEETAALEAALSNEQDSDVSSVISKYKSYAGIDDLAEANLRELLDRVTIYPDGILRVRLNFSDEMEKLAESLNIGMTSA